MSRGKTIDPSQTVAWLRPPFGIVKVNVYSSLPRSGKKGIDIVVRDSFCEILGSALELQDRSITVECAEATAVLRGMIFVKIWVFKKLL